MSTKRENSIFNHASKKNRRSVGLITSAMSIKIMFNKVVFTRAYTDNAQYQRNCCTTCICFIVHTKIDLLLYCTIYLQWSYSKTIPMKPELCHCFTTFHYIIIIESIFKKKVYKHSRNSFVIFERFFSVNYFCLLK